MMGRGADGGCVANRNSCPIQKGENLGKTDSMGVNSTLPERSGVNDALDRMGMDVFSQVYKALATRHPFEKRDGVTAASDGAGAPQTAAGLGDGRRRPKRVQGTSSGAKIGKSREGRCSNPWDDFEEFFREVGVEDVELLQRYCSYCDLCFNNRPAQKSGSDDLLFDVRGVDVGTRAEWKGAVRENLQFFSGSDSSIDARQTETVVLSTTHTEPAAMEICEIDHAAKENADKHCCGGRETILHGSPELEMKSGAKLNSCGALQETAVNNHIAEHDYTNCHAKSVAGSLSLEQEQMLGTNLEGSQERDAVVNDAALNQKKSCVETKLIAPSMGRKKRKMVSESAEEVTTSVLSPKENSEDELCHVCYIGDSDESNQILFCDVCNVPVHQQCYGVQEIPTGQWLCSWCSYYSQSQSMCKSFTRSENGSVNHKKTNGVHNDSHPCILCPVGGGALKPVYRSDSREHVDGSLQFAHLFCSNWIPETYVENPDVMQPIVNVEGIMEARWKLLCSLCKEKHGACIQCSHGNCTIAFHPLCARGAREMQLRMEISRKGTDDVELCAFCPKHTLTRTGNGGADGLSEVEIVTSKENRLSQYSNEICLRQSTQLPSTLSGYQSFLAQNSDKQIADQGDLLQEMSGIESKISDVDSEVQGSSAVGFHENELTKDLQNTNGNSQNEYLEKNDAASSGEVRGKQLIINGDLLLEKSMEKNLQNTSIKGEGNSVVMEGHSSGLPFEADQVEMPRIDVLTDADIESHGSDTQRDQRMYIDGTERLYSKATDEITCLHGRQNAEQETISRDYQLKQLSDARSKGILDLAPQNEIESEILFWHQQLLENVQRVHGLCDDLVFRVITHLPKERKQQLKQKENKALADEFLRQAREAKKQGRKERRHKEAQATAAAVTAAAAASSRLASSRKDGSVDTLVRNGLGQAILSDRNLQADELSTRTSFSGILPSAQLMTIFHPKDVKTNIGTGRPSSSSQPMARTTFSRPTFARVSSEKLHDESLLCDICQLPETTRANKLFICCHCKVAVHENCYGIPSLHSADWCCEPCQEMHRNYPNMKLSSAVRQGGPAFILECALCGGRSGVLKRTIDGQWVHNFCAEWILENTFRRGQSEPVVGLESLPRERGMLICSVCRQQGVCLKCNFGHCHTMFHPLCARDSGFLMSVSTHFGKIQHKAYCEKHSSEKKLKTIQAESRRCGGTEELKFIKQLRVMLERMRLICERTVRREKLKRELVHNTHNELASKRDFIAYSAVFHGSFPPVDVGSNADIAQDSVVTSVWKHKTTEKHHSDGNFIPSIMLSRPRASLSGHFEVKHPMVFRDDKSFGRTAFSGDSLALIGESESSRKRSLYIANSSALDDRDDVHRRSKKSRTHAETLKREVVMTPLEANMQNQRLPKGYIYVPVRDLAKGKTTPPNFRHDS